MNLLNQKKGIVFTIIALTTGAFILLMFFYMYELPLDHDVEVNRMRIRTVNSFLGQADDLLNSQIISSSVTAIDELVNIMHEQNSFFGSFDDEFRNCLNNEQIIINGDTYECGEDAHFKDIIEENLKEFLQENVNLNVDFNISNIALSQASPWKLNVSFDVRILVEEEYFAWDLNKNLWNTFSIVGMKDPTHAVYHNSLADFGPQSPDDIITIEFPSLSRNITSDWIEKPATLNEVSKENRYFEHTIFGVSYLDRLRGDFTPSNQGILRVQIPFYEEIDEYDTVIRRGISDLDWHFWQNLNTFVGAHQMGEYNFTRNQDKIEVLGLNMAPFISLNNTLHKVRIPVSLAQEANVNGSDYFYPIS